MFLSNRKKVEEDLERIRKANIPPEQLLHEQNEEKQLKEKAEKLGFTDIIAMVIAILSLILPYAFAFIILLFVFNLIVQALA